MATVLTFRQTGSEQGLAEETSPEEGVRIVYFSLLSKIKKNQRHYESRLGKYCGTD